MKFKLNSSDPVHGKEFLHKLADRNDVKWHKEFKCCFVY